MTIEDEPLRYASVCSGIEAVTLAWHPLGIRAAWYSEIDPFACAVLMHHYPKIQNLGDMTELPAQVLSRSIEAPDILVGGTPCQSFSVAGLRLGLSDSRGALTLKYVELANALDQVRRTQKKVSSVIVWENVPGVLSDARNAFGCFLGALVGEERELRAPGRSWTHAGCVYGPRRSAAWRILDAQYFGVAQRRKRVFVVASARANFDPGRVLFESESVRRDTPPRAAQCQNAAGAVGASADHPGAARNAPETWQGQELGACFGGGRHEAIEQAACLTARGERLDFRTETFALQSLTGLISRPLTRAHSVTEDGNGRGTPVIAVRYRVETGELTPPLAPVTLAFAQNSRGEVRLENGNGQLIGMLSTGGGIPGQGMPAAITLSIRGPAQPGSLAEEPRLASTLRSSDRGGIKSGTLWPSFDAHLRCTAEGERGLLQWQVRRLMPLECERLQGLPDHYTNVPFRGKAAADAPRYAAIGNSMATPCIGWLGRRLLLEHHRALRT